MPLLVFYPDRPEYLQAVLGALAQLGKFWTWGKEGPVPTESDAAAQSFNRAYQETLKGIEMNWLTLMLEAVDDVEDLLAQLRVINQYSLPDCCDQISPGGDEVPPTNSLPSTWGNGEPVTDENDWLQLRCGAGHAYVDKLKSMLAEMSGLVEAGIITIAAIAAILALLSGAGLIAAIGYGAAAGIFSAIVSLVSGEAFDDAIAEIEAARDSIATQVACGTAASLAAAVQAAVNATAWGAFLAWVNYENAYNVMLSGTWDGEYLPVSRNATCDCVEDCTLTNFGTNGDGIGPWEVQFGAGFVGADSIELNNAKLKWPNVAFPANQAVNVKFEVRFKRFFSATQADIKVGIENIQTGTVTQILVSPTPDEWVIMEHTFQGVSDDNGLVGFVLFDEGPSILVDWVDICWSYQS